MARAAAPTSHHTAFDRGRTTGVAAVVLGAGMVVTWPPQGSCVPYVVGHRDGAVSDSPAKRSRAHSGATVLDFHQLPHAVTQKGTLRAAPGPVNDGGWLRWRARCRSRPVPGPRRMAGRGR